MPVVPRVVRSMSRDPTPVPFRLAGEGGASGRFALPIPGRGAVWLARLTGGQKVGGSNPLGPTGRSAGQGPFLGMAPPASSGQVTNGVTNPRSGGAGLDHHRVGLEVHETD